jgi:hypothetical protein
MGRRQQRWSSFQSALSLVFISNMRELQERLDSLPIDRTDLMCFRSSPYRRGIIYLQPLIEDTYTLKPGGAQFPQSIAFRVTPLKKDVQFLRSIAGVQFPISAVDHLSVTRCPPIVPASFQAFLAIPLSCNILLS